MIFHYLIEKIMEFEGYTLISTYLELNVHSMDIELSYLDFRSLRFHNAT